MAEETLSGGASPRGPVLVAVGYGDAGPGLVRAAGALARGMGTGLECLTVDTGEKASDAGEERLAEAQRLARALGASISCEPGIDLAPSILKRAMERKASALVVGTGGRRRIRRSLLDRLRSAEAPMPILGVSEAGGGAARDRPRPARPLGRPAHYVAAVAIVAAASAVSLPLADFAGYWAASILYLAGISLMALVLDRGPVLLAALLSAVAWDCLFIPPRFTLRISNAEDILMLCLFFVVAACSGWMTGRLRSSERLLAAREARLSRMNSLANALAGARTMGEILSSGIEAIEAACEAEAIVILREKGGGLKAEAESGWEPLDANARASARLCQSEGKVAGRFTEYFPESEWHFVAMEGPRYRLGVVGVRVAHDRPWNEANDDYLRMLSSTLSIAVARELE